MVALSAENWYNSRATSIPLLSPVRQDDDPAYESRARLP